jgi:hypothetical protein
VTTADEDTVADNMVPNDYNRIVYPTSKISLWQSYSSLPPQHPIRFLGLCAQVFFYYVAYGYLQVGFIEIKLKNLFNSLLRNFYLH